MNSHGLTRENLVATLPPALQKDPSAVALAEAMADLLAQRPEEIEQLRIYPVIDRLDERLLDILAYDFKVDWWDADYSLEEKRRTLKDSWRVHKLLDLTGTFWTEERPRRILERVNFYKSLRSHVDGLEYTRYPAQPARLYVGGAGGILSTMGIPQDTGLPEPSGVQSRTIYTGGTFAARTVLPVPEDSTLPGATTILRTGGVCTIISNLSGGSN